VHSCAGVKLPAGVAVWEVGGVGGVGVGGLMCLVGVVGGGIRVLIADVGNIFLG